MVSVYGEGYPEGWSPEHPVDPARGYIDPAAYYSRTPPPTAPTGVTDTAIEAFNADVTRATGQSVWEYVEPVYGVLLVSPPAPGQPSQINPYGEVFWSLLKAGYNVDQINALMKEQNESQYAVRLPGGIGEVELFNQFLKSKQAGTSSVPESAATLETITSTTQPPSYETLKPLFLSIVAGLIVTVIVVLLMDSTGTGRRHRTEA